MCSVTRPIDVGGSASGTVAFLVLYPTRYIRNYYLDRVLEKHEH